MIPIPFNQSYLPYQIEGIEFARGRSQVLFADEMGLGKTVEAIGVMNTRPEIGRALVVCPASLRVNWNRELAKFLVSPCVDIDITNYEQLHKLDLTKPYDLAILDEAHYIKNPETQRSQLCAKIKAETRLALTGTPILNRPIELYNLLKWLKPETFTDGYRNQYALRYCNKHLRTIVFWKRTPRGRIKIAKRVWDDSGASHLDELRLKLRNIMIRRLTDEVLPDLPPLRRQLIEIPVSGLSTDLRKRVMQATAEMDRIAHTYERDVQRMDEQLEVAWGEMGTVLHDLEVAKIPIILPMVEDAIESLGKVVVMCYHRKAIEDLTHALYEHRPAVIHGSVRDRQELVDRFQTDPACKAFIGQIQAAGVGLTLTASNLMMFTGRYWSPSTMAQAEKRCHRIGQTKSVLVQHLIMENSLEVRVAQRCIEKQQIINQALDGR